MAKHGWELKREHDERLPGGPGRSRTGRAFGRTHALRGLSATIEPGEIVAITGPSGSGKSTADRVSLTVRRAGRALIRAG